MPNAAKITMLLYGDGLSPNETQRLEHLDGPIVEALLEAGINARAMWSGATTGNGRLLRLDVAGHPRPIFEIDAAALPETSDADLLSSFRNTLR